MVLLRRILLKPSILLLLYSSNVIGANWAYVVSADTLKVWVDTDSLRSSGTRVKAWAKWVYSQPVLIAASDPKLYFRSMMSLSIYQCDDRTGAEIQVLTYSDADATESIRTRTYPDIPSRYQDVVPESVGEKVHLFVCKASAASRK